jgi:hypothetical protein
MTFVKIVWHLDTIQHKLKEFTYEELHKKMNTEWSHTFIYYGGGVTYWVKKLSNEEVWMYLLQVWRNNILILIFLLTRV